MVAVGYLAIAVHSDDNTGAVVDKLVVKTIDCGQGFFGLLSPLPLPLQKVAGFLESGFVPGQGVVPAGFRPLRAVRYTAIRDCGIVFIRFYIRFLLKHLFL